MASSWLLGCFVSIGAPVLWLSPSPPRSGTHTELVAKWTRQISVTCFSVRQMFPSLEAGTWRDVLVGTVMAEITDVTGSADSH